MRAWVIGKVVGVEQREYKRRDGSTGADLNVYVKQDGSSDRYGPDRLTAPATADITEGQRVSLLVNFSERHGTKASDGSVWGMLNAFIVEVHPAPADAKLKSA